MIYVLSDIHGNMRRFESILDQIELKPDDTLYVLGDVIDRHPNGIDILRQIIKADNIKMLLGNHEYMMLNAIYPGDLPWSHYRDPGDDMYLWCQRNNGEVTYKAFRRLTNEQQTEIFDYLIHLPLGFDVEIGDKMYRLVHAAPAECFYAKPGYAFMYDDETEFAVWARDCRFEPVSEKETVIYGHTPTINLKAQQFLSVLDMPEMNAIDIDCGSGFPEIMTRDMPIQGRLACLRLDDMKEFYSEEKPVEGAEQWFADILMKERI